jgi:hypothetical protein
VQYSVRADSVYAQLAGAEPDDETYNVILQDLRLAHAAAEEVAKFLPAGLDSIPDDTVWSARGRDARDRSPQLFERSWVDEVQRHHRSRLDAFAERYGPGD